MTLSISARGTAKPASVIPPEAPRQEHISETPSPPAATTEEKKDDFLSPKFAALARQEKQIRTERAKLKAERDAWENERKTQLNGYIQKDKFKADPLAAFEEAGLSYDDVAQKLLNAPQSEIDPTIRALQAKIHELETRQTTLAQKAEESQTAAYKQALDSIRHKVKGMVDASPEFEMIKAMDQSEAVVALIEETFKAEGYVMDEAEAAKEVESYLEEEAIKMASLEKIKKKLAPAPVEPTVPTQQAKPQQSQIKTLTNAVSASTRPRRTEAERRERAILAAKGLLKD